MSAVYWLIKRFIKLYRAALPANEITWWGPAATVHSLELSFFFFLTASVKDRPWPFPLCHSLVISLLSLPFLAPFFFLMLFIPSLIAALGFTVSSAFAQSSGTFVVVGDTLVSAMMVCRQFASARPHR